MLQLTDGQKDALRKAVEWYFSTDYNKNNLFVIGGYAGCGKTTIVKILTDILGLERHNVIYTAYTGKAVNVLRMKGNMAHTIHKTFYNIYKGKKGFSFRLKASLPSPIELVVVDEMSMLNNKFIEDILTFGVPTIGLGDPGQLPPIFGVNDYIALENIDVFLKEIMRQDNVSGILDLSVMARNGTPISLGTYKNSKVIALSDIKDIEKYDIVLCWKNSTRRNLNKIIREKLGYKSVLPTSGEKLICLKNNYMHEVEADDINIMPVNGLNCLSISDAKIDENDESVITIKYKPDFLNNNDVFFDTRCERIYFDMYKLVDQDEFTPFIERTEEEEDIVHLDYGYALTVHKSQGSEWNNVLLIDEFQGDPEVYKKWLYTGITRARKSVTIAKTT